MLKQKMKVPFRKLKHIHHISDIQIRNLKRHREYEEVFNKLYEEVKKNPKNAISYIGGDIAHSKTEMSPELVDQLSRLFKNLADICPLVIIAGNHDANLNNPNRMDVLTPIVENLNHPNLHYLKRTGIYRCADTNLVVWDVWDKETDYIKAKDVKQDGKNVVLYHGTVDRSETDLGFKLPSKVKMKMFKDYIDELKSSLNELIIAGDYNICHKAIDIHDPVRNKNDSGFLPIERTWLDCFISSGYVDSFRQINDSKDMYSWWSYRANSRQNNKGWRIDYNLVSKS